MHSASDEQEAVLAAGGVTHVVQVSRTVRRPVRPFTSTIQDYLVHLRSRGFYDAPEPLGYDASGREVLSYVDGDVPTEPLPDYATAAEVLVALAQLIRRLHDAAQGSTPAPDALCGNIPGGPSTGLKPLFDQPELVSHQDDCPGNVVFRDGLPAALIDFDATLPDGRPVWLTSSTPCTGGLH